MRVLTTFLCAALAFPCSVIADDALFSQPQCDSSSSNLFRSIIFKFPNFFPEGITYDPETDQLLVGSLSQPLVIGLPLSKFTLQPTPRGDFVEYSVVVNDTASGDVGGFGGIHLDAKRRVLHAVARTESAYVSYEFGKVNDTGGGAGLSREVDVKRTARVPLGDVFAGEATAGAHVLNDLAVVDPGEDGDVTLYGTDTASDVVLRFEPERTSTTGASGTVFSRDPAFSKPPVIFKGIGGLNGIAYARTDMSSPSCPPVLLTGSVSNGRLFNLDLEAGAATLVDAPHPIPADGLSFISSKLAVVSTSVPNDQAVFLRSTDCWKSAEVVWQVDLQGAGVGGVRPGVTTHVVVNGMVYVLGARVDAFMDSANGSNVDQYNVIAIPVPELV